MPIIERVGGSLARIRLRSAMAAVIAAWLWLGMTPYAAADSGRAGQTNAEAIQSFRQSAESLYDAVQQGDRLRMTQSLRELENGLRALPLEQVATAEGIEALAGSVSDMKRAAAAVSGGDRDELERAAGTVRLAADELASPDRPMWHGYRSLLREDIRALRAALAGTEGNAGDDRLEEARAALSRIERKYRLIRPAASLRGEPSAIERADSVLRYADRVLRPAKPDLARVGALDESISASLEALFPAEGRTASVPGFMPPTWGFAATIGSFIVTILSWNGWRRYRYDRKRPPAVPPTDQR